MSLRHHQQSAVLTGLSICVIHCVRRLKPTVTIPVVPTALACKKNPTNDYSSQHSNHKELIATNCHRKSHRELHRSQPPQNPKTGCPPAPSVRKNSVGVAHLLTTGFNPWDSPPSIPRVPTARTISPALGDGPQVIPYTASTEHN